MEDPEFLKHLDTGFAVSYFPHRPFGDAAIIAEEKAVAACSYFWWAALALWIYLLFSYLLLTRMVTKFRKLRCVDTATMQDDWRNDSDDDDDDSEEDGGVWGLIIGSSSSDDSS